MDKKVDWMKTPADGFLLEAEKFDNEKDAAKHFGMGVARYRDVRTDALISVKANTTFAVRYFVATHPMATRAEIAEALGTSESTVRELLKHGRYLRR